jgi:hypothetical protein
VHVVRQLDVRARRERDRRRRGGASRLLGSHKQIFGVNEQIPGRGQTYLSDISLKVMCEKQRTSTFSHHRRVKRLSLIRSAN